ncbi:T-cell immunoglobulin and mucin domain-containing protein 4 isoform X2 [Dipodomys spectabilis]|uniref:T-cell immunoglobulin and mucin domain-containing protein 4 isoform X2 n=1 Tax=Dipodomys spectabilis TaxID=105255 RepID=UPI001C53993B|nr:T-cell immunoglobulin and mucin domain-containing protein 4 isoform X2 [Dipodomys spectabilis]
MATGLLILWLAMGLGWLFPTPTSAERTVTGTLGQAVILPCVYSSWSQSRNSMCWGKGPCPKSKCTQELLHTDGARVIAGKLDKYQLQGDIQKGDISLTIAKAEEGDAGVYCCRIEVPGWFNDVKRNIRLLLRRAPKPKVPTTTSPTTTPRPTTALHLTTTTEGPPTAVMATSALTTRAPPQTSASPVLPTAGTTCPAPSSSPLPQPSTPLSTETSTGPSTAAAESETSLQSTNSPGATEAPPADSALPMSKGMEGWVLWSQSPAMKRGRKDMEPSRSGDQKKNTGHSNGESNQVSVPLIIASTMGFVLFLAFLLAFLLRGKLTKTNCLQKHKRLDTTGESKTVLDDLQHGGDDEEGLFTL